MKDLYFSDFEMSKFVREIVEFWFILNYQNLISFLKCVIISPSGCKVFNFS